MIGKYFGTDGIRGPVGKPPLTPLYIARLAHSAAGWAFAKGGGSVAIGRDTRASGVWMEQILAGVLSAHGLDVFRLGVRATPAIAVATRSHGAILGLALTASHNSSTDNGVKFFGADGFKLPDADQRLLEAGIDSGADEPALPSRPGSITEGAPLDAYLDGLVASLPGRQPLAGLHLVIDCANGAASAYAPALLARLGAKVDAICHAPDGVNINAGCGATQPGALAKKVVEVGADAGLALDGDADRLIMVDEAGAVIDGDQLLALLAIRQHTDGHLKGDGAVSTIMANLGFRRHMQERGLSLAQTKVGDQYVVEAMRAGGFNLGGEQSGHIILMDHATTGDGLLAAAHVLAIAAAEDQPFSELAHVFEPVPQRLVNVPFSGADPLLDQTVQTVISDVEAGLGDRGRILVRKSGTEPLIRIMCEALDPDELQRALERLSASVRAAAGD